ncbi:uncharacterized protein LOC130981855 [Arachis stenosperma]|uniref:uncharacterized protein LOC130981855 n=1 Tax=Arachis stenosperma TaxID=217475 RepID=UPI0025ABAF03|nr:uncharacterized protein LOC130981855 [Arachis stenosperma]
MVTRMIELDGVPWRDDDEIPPPSADDDKEDVIPWGGWVHERAPSRRRSRARAVIEGARPPSAPAGPSSSAAAAPTPPPPAPEPTYLLGIELPHLPESSGSDEVTREEEHAEAHEEELVHMEAPPQTQETQEPQPQPQPEPEPTGVLLPEPED